MTTYQEFLREKLDYSNSTGFDIELEQLHLALFPFQRHLTQWALKKGCAAIFADCGMGKTLMQLVWADHIVQRTNKPVLILAPLAVSTQTMHEAHKFEIDARVVTHNEDYTGIQITNYEKLHHFEARDYAGVVCDESSILKNFDGKRRRQITEFMRVIPYRLLCTATAAPNDWMELGTSSEALGYLGHVDMLTRFFTNKGSTFYRRDSLQGKQWRLKGHARTPFWQWVASWARALRRPSDFGFDDDGFILPPLKETHTVVKATRPTPGMLFDMPAANFQEEREAIRRTIEERCEEAAARVRQNGHSMVWCHLNDESALLHKLIPGSVEIKGSDSDERKEEAANWFVYGKEEKRVLISKPTIFGFGLNFQHCHHMTYFPTHSYEQYYQATRRLWRFGQEKPVTVDLIYTDSGKRIIRNLERKSKAADKMFDELVKHMNEAMHIRRDSYQTGEVEIPQWMRNSNGK